MDLKIYANTAGTLEQANFMMIKTTAEKSASKELVVTASYLK